MALIQCKECGSQVSDKATVCPQCGNPLKNSPRCKKSLWYILGIFAIAAIIGSCLLFLNGRNDFPGAASDIVNITPEFSKKIRNYKQVSDFSEGYAAVMRDGKWGYIDMNGDEVISCRYDYAYPFIEGIARVVIDDKDRYINIKAEEVKDGVYRYNKKAVVESDSPYILFKSEDEKYGYKDENGTVVIPAKYNFLGSFNNCVAVAVLETIGVMRTEDYDPSHEMTIYGYIDSKGNSTFTDSDFGEIERRNQAILQDEKRREEKRIEEVERRCREGRTFTISLSFTCERNMEGSHGVGYDPIYFDYVITKNLRVPEGKVWIFKNVTSKYIHNIPNYRPMTRPNAFLAKLGNNNKLYSKVEYNGHQFRKYGGEEFVLGIDLMHGSDNRITEVCEWEVVEKDETYAY